MKNTAGNLISCESIRIFEIMLLSTIKHLFRGTKNQSTDSLFDLPKVWSREGASRINDTADECAKLYIDLLKRCVGNFIYDNDLDLMKGRFELDSNTGRYVSTPAGTVAPERKYFGGIWPTHAHTMIGIPRLENLQWCVEDVLKNRIPGDLIETGVWRGGASIFMRGILKAYGITDRRVWVADSFEGLPKADPVLNAADGEMNLGGFKSEVQPRYDASVASSRRLRGVF